MELRDKLNKNKNLIIGVIGFTLLYPLFGLLIKIPNPMVPGAIIALNMVFPVLAGYFYGPKSGFFAGGIGTALASLIGASIWDGLAIFPHIVMGLTAGWVITKSRSDFLCSLTIIIGHTVNILFFVRLELMSISIDNIGDILLGLLTETMIDIIVILFLTSILKRWLFQKERW